MNRRGAIGGAYISVSMLLSGCGESEKVITKSIENTGKGFEVTLMKVLNNGEKRDTTIFVPVIQSSMMLDKDKSQTHYILDIPESKRITKELEDSLYSLKKKEFADSVEN